VTFELKYKETGKDRQVYSCSSLRKHDKYAPTPCTIRYDTDKQHLCNKQYRHPSYDRHFRFQRL